MAQKIVLLVSINEDNTLHIEATVFRINAPFDDALTEMLRHANIISVDTVSVPGVSQFNIDT